jgi:perosamine synthetase
MRIRIPLSTISLSEVERRHTLEALEQEALSSTGPHVLAFEEQLASRIGVRHVVATSSGTSALELLLRAMEIGPGDEVIVPALTFAGPALAVALVGATPVFVDVTSDNWTIDTTIVNDLRTPRTRAVIAVDVLGHPCDYDGLGKLGIPIIEDAAEAHGARYKRQNVGSFGVGAIFSFHANKLITCGEGGCVLTNDEDLYKRLRRLNSFGMDPQRRYWHIEIGCNHRMSNLLAAVALGQLERWDELVEGRARVAAAYDQALAGLDVQRRPVSVWADEAVWLYTIGSDRREAILRVCQERGIDARAIWPVLPDNPAFARFPRGPYPQATAIAGRALWLPTWSHMPEDMIRDVARAVADGLD